MTDRPWMTALEMQFAALKVLNAEGIDKNRIDASTTFNDFLRKAETFAWSRESSTAVSMAAKTIPGTSTLSTTALPSNTCGWWWFDQPIHVDAAGGAEVSGLLFGRATDNQVWFRVFVSEAYAMSKAMDQINEDASGTDDAISRLEHNAALLAARGFNLIPLMGWSFDTDGPSLSDFIDDVRREMAKHPERIPIGELIIQTFRIFLAGCAWLQQRIVSVGSGHVERHRRKQLSREHDATVSDVKVVQLRRLESQAKNTDASVESVEWTCRWIVNGHWRNQFHPSTGKHELKYILPYVKGPDDKPLKVPTHTVYAVER